MRPLADGSLARALTRLCAAAYLASVCDAQRCASEAGACTVEETRSAVEDASVLLQKSQVRSITSQGLQAQVLRAGPKLVKGNVLTSLGKDSYIGLLGEGQRLAHGQFSDRIVVGKEEIVDTFQNPKCRNFYSIRASPESPTVVDKQARLFRPAAEIDYIRDGTEPSLPATQFKRMVTYEDVAFPRDFHSGEINKTDGGSLREETWCEMFSVRTPQRPVKVMTATGRATGLSLALPAIWKVATTSITTMLQAAQKEGTATDFRHPHGSYKPNPDNPLDQAEKYTTFHEDADAAIKAAFVRSPLERFLASIYEHGEWQACGGKPCASVLAHAKKMAQTLASDFPHAYRSCEHPSQSYFLSATDIHGEPYTWNHIFRLEELEDGLKQLEATTGISLRSKSENTSGNHEMKKMYFKAIFADLVTLCSVCKVYAQDFECLGYAKPDRCTQESCLKVGVSLDVPVE